MSWISNARIMVFLLKTVGWNILNVASPKFYILFKQTIHVVDVVSRLKVSQSWMFKWFCFLNEIPNRGKVFTGFLYVCLEESVYSRKFREISRFLIKQTYHCGSYKTFKRIKVTQRVVCLPWTQISENNVSIYWLYSTFHLRCFLGKF